MHHLYDICVLVDLATPVFAMATYNISALKCLKTTKPV